MKRKPIVNALLLALFGTASISNLANAASYEVQELPLSDVSQSHFAASIDNTGLMLSIARDVFNQPIDLSLIDLDSINLNDPEGAAEGNFDDEDYTRLVNVLLTAGNTLGTGTSTISADTRFQKLASEIGYQSDGMDIRYVNGFDIETEGTNGFTFAINTRLTDSALGTHIIGNMPGAFYRVEHIDENDEEQVFVINDFIRRGFVQVGDKTTPLTPSNTDAGGFSEAYDISSNLLVAGVSSVDSNDTIKERIAVCADEDDGPDLPINVCTYTIFNQSDFGSRFIAGSVIANNSMELRPTVWQLDADGEIISEQVYDVLYNPEEFDGTNHSRGLSVNNAGVMVGFSGVFVEAPRITNVPVAAIFENGQTSRLVEDEEFLPSFATHINDNNIAIGYVVRSINNAGRNKLFTFDRNTNELNVVQGFFVGSAAVPRALNNNNVVVGDAESDVSTSSSQRPRVGFMYDIDSDTFTDLNTLLPCDSPYQIVSAVDINDDNVIIADAFISVPRKNARGVVLTDDDGEVLEIDTVVSVKMSPTGDAPSDCSDDTPEFRERQGASVSFWLTIPLILLGVYRRSKQ